MSEIELKRCPFCGSDRTCIDYADVPHSTCLIFIRCKGCGAGGGKVTYGRASPYEAWNTRPLEAHQSALLAKAVEALEKYADWGYINDFIDWDGVCSSHDLRLEAVELAEQTLAEINKGE